MSKSVEEESFERIFNSGIKVRRAVLGDDYVDRSLERTQGTESESLQHVVTQNVWGTIWTRPGLEMRERSLINIGMLVAMNQHHELSIHIHGGIRNGLTRTQITEAIIQASVYCGAPSGLAAMRVAQSIFDEQN